MLWTHGWKFCFLCYIDGRLRTIETDISSLYLIPPLLNWLLCFLLNSIHLCFKTHTKLNPIFWVKYPYKLFLYWPCPPNLYSKILDKVMVPYSRWDTKEVSIKQSNTKQQIDVSSGKAGQGLIDCDAGAGTQCLMCDRQVSSHWATALPKRS